MIANSSTRRTQIAVSSNICGFLLLCLRSSLVSTIVASIVLADTWSASVVVALESSAVTWDPFSCPNVLPAPHFFRSASSSRLGGSGSSSRLVCWQCGQVQSLDLVHKGPLALSSYAKTVITIITETPIFSFHPQDIRWIQRRLQPVPLGERSLEDQ